MPTRGEYTVTVCGAMPASFAVHTSSRSMPDATVTSRAQRPTVGAWVVAAMLGLGVALAVFALWFQWRQTRRCLAFYGSEAAHRIQVAPRVELWCANPAGVVTRPAPEHRLDISTARGLVHLRHGLVEDANFAWGDAAPEAGDDPTIALAFFDGEAADCPRTVLVVRLDEHGGWLEVVGRPGRLALGRIATGLRTWLIDVLARAARPR